MGLRYQYLLVIMKGNLLIDQILDKIIYIKTKVDEINPPYYPDKERIIDIWKIILEYPELFGAQVQIFRSETETFTGIFGAHFESADQFIDQAAIPFIFLESEIINQIDTIALHNDISKGHGKFFTFLTLLKVTGTEQERTSWDELKEIQLGIKNVLMEDQMEEKIKVEIETFQKKFRNLLNKLNHEIPSDQELEIYNNVQRIMTQWQDLVLTGRTYQSTSNPQPINSADFIKLEELYDKTMQELRAIFVDNQTMIFPTFEAICGDPKLVHFQFVDQFRVSLEQQLENYSLAEFELIHKMTSIFIPEARSQLPNLDPQEHLHFEDEPESPSAQPEGHHVEKFFKYLAQPLSPALKQADIESIILIIANILHEIHDQLDYYKNYTLYYMQEGFEQSLMIPDYHSYPAISFFNIHESNQITNGLWLLTEQESDLSSEDIDLAPLCNLIPKSLGEFQQHGIFITAWRSESTFQLFTGSDYYKPHYWTMFTSLQTEWKLDILNKLYQDYRFAQDVLYRTTLERKIKKSFGQRIH